MSQDSELEVEIARGMDSVPEAEWDALLQPNDPFTTHAFLLALEASGSASQDTGWMPLHVLCRRDGKLVGAAPLYLKDHSYGEYIFDWGWAQAAQRAGIPYYPKLVCAVPFTPATGRRLLVAPDQDRPSIQRALLGGMMHVARQTQAESLHILFCTEAEWTELGQSPGLIPRSTFQFHWQHPGVKDFEGWLETFRARRRKEARRERKKVEELDVEVQVLRGESLQAVHWDALEGFYRDTVSRKWGQAYLHPEFFKQARTRLAHLALGIVAMKDQDVVAGALTFQRGQHLYGRYWGCKPGFERLHFELCYHRPIEICIENGWTRFEAGAQGEHKLSRGLMPSPTRSLHWIGHSGLAHAIEAAVEAESEQTDSAILQLTKHGPFRRES